MKKTTLILCLVLMLSRLYAQTPIENMNNYYPPSPEAASLLSKSNNYSVNYYKGKLTYSAPIFQQNFSGINIDVGLEYSTSGFKVQEIAGSTGLGWSSSAVGVIGRYVEGLPDDDVNGYCGQNRIGDKTYAPFNEDYFTKITNGDWDSQPDKFFFSFLGISGAIRLNTDGEPILESAMQGLKIEYCPFSRSKGRMAGGLEQWILIDQNGTRYFFGNDNVETTHSKVTQGDKTTEKTFMSSWFLTKIITATNKNIYFKYIKGEPTTQIYFVNIKTSILTSGGCTASTPEYFGNADVYTTINSPLYLSQIASDQNDITVNFNYGQTRADLINGKILTDISLKYNGIEKKSYLLDYDYFLSTDGSGTKRLKLNEIKEKSTIGSLNLLYRFFYNETAILPARNSIKTDYWGYYNNNTGGSNVEGYLNALKTPDTFNTKACVLTKVINKTGGSISFEYEQNTYKNGSSNVDGGGIRIKSKSEKADEGRNSESTLVEEYLYTDELNQFSSGQIYLTQQNRELKYELITFYSIGGAVWSCSILVSYKYSEPLISIFDLNETSVGYSNVRIKRLNGTTKYKFTNFSDKPDELEEGKFGNGDVLFANTRPQFPSTSYAFVRGKIKSEELFDTSGQKVKSSTYEYEYTPASNPIIGIKAFLMGSAGNSNKYHYGRYLFSNQDYRVKSITDTLFKSGNSRNRTKQEFEYNMTVKNLISSKKISNISGQNVKQVFSYPFEDLTDAALKEMNIRNMVANPFKTEKFVNNIFISQDFTNYKIWTPSIIGPSSIDQQIGTAIKRRKAIFNAYDDYGNLIESQKPEGIKESYLWGYNGQYMVAKIVGASYSDALKQIDSKILNSTANYTDQQVRVELNKLRLNLSDAQVTTFTYEPLVGMTSKTDLKGQITYYEYDDFQRLKNIKDQHQNLVKNIKYNYDQSINAPYGNDLQSKSFQKVCPIGQTGSWVTYTVPAGTFTSRSRDEANTKALKDIDLNGQNYANLNGNCTASICTVTATSIQSSPWTIVMNLVNKSTNETYFLMGGAKAVRTASVPSGEYRLDVTWYPVPEAGKYYLIGLNDNIQTISTASGSSTSFNITINGNYSITAKYR